MEDTAHSFPHRKGSKTEDENFHFTRETLVIKM